LAELTPQDVWNDANQAFLAVTDRLTKIEARLKKIEAKVAKLERGF